MSFVQKNYNLNFNLENFFKEIKLKKQCVQKLKNKVILLNTLKERDYKKINSSLFISDNNQKLVKEDFLITYIIDITFSKTNTLLHVMDFSGNLKFFCSAGSLQYKGKGKKSRSLVIKDMYKILMLKLKFLKDQPVALHLKNVGFAKFWIIKLFKKKFFIKVVRSFNSYPYNGCRKRKMRRKKF
jgi:ribosomal protein S11